MPKVTFNEDYETKEAEPQKFEKGKSYDMEDASAEHHINRGRAVLAKTAGKGGKTTVKEAEK